MSAPVELKRGVLVYESRLDVGDLSCDCVLIAPHPREEFDIASGGRLSRETLQGWPSSSSLWSAIETAEPGAVVDRIDGAGLYPGTPGRFSVRGTSWTQNRYVLDGLDVTDVLGGGVPLAYPEAGALDAIDVTSALAPVEYGAPGATVALTPRTPSDEWRGRVDLGWAPGFLQDENVAMAPAIARFGNASDARVSGEGALRAGLRTFASASLAQASRFERGASETRAARTASLFNHTVWDAGAGDRIKGTVLFQAIGRPAALPHAPRWDRVDGLVTQLRWEHGGARATSEVFAGLSAAVERPGQAAGTGGLPVERLLDGPVPQLIRPERSRQGTWTLGGSLGLAARRTAGLWHAPRFGVTAARSWVRERGADGVRIAENVDGIAARVWDVRYGAPESRRHAFTLNAFAADRLVWRDRVFVEAGLRFDSTSGEAVGAAQGISWTSLVPRLSARWRVTDFGRLSLFAGYAQYRHRLLLSHLAWGDPAAAQASVYRWKDGNGDGLFGAGERGFLIAREGPGDDGGGLATIDSGLRQPRTRELVGGVETQPGRGWSVKVTAFGRRETDLIESVNVGVPQASYDVRWMEDPAGDILGAQDDQLLPVYARRAESFGQDRYVLTNPAGHTSEYKGLEMRIEKRIGARLALLAGATAFRADAAGGSRGFRVFENDYGVIGELYDAPNAETHALGRSFFDRAYVGKIAASYRGPWGWRLGTVARYHDGQAFGRWQIVEHLPQGPEAIQAVPRGQLAQAGAMDDQGHYLIPSGHRFTYTLTWDARLEKEFRTGRRRIAATAEVFNLLNLKHEVEEDAVSGARFRTPTAVQPPRAFRLGLRCDF